VTFDGLARPAAVALVQAALETKRRHRLSYWDAAIIEAAKFLECETLLSEDLAHSRDYDGVRVANPFRSSASSAS